MKTKSQIDLNKKKLKTRLHNPRKIQLIVLRNENNGNLIALKVVRKCPQKDSLKGSKNGPINGPKAKNECLLNCLKDLPKNVLTSSWVPQQDVLGHPNLKVFVTHGGLGSVMEAIHHKG